MTDLTAILHSTPNGTMELSYFIPSFLEDNQILLKKDPGYESRLMARDPILARALRYGDWAVFAGMLLREWLPNEHVCQPFTIPVHWLRWRAIDWGFAAPFCCLWFAKHPDNGRSYVYQELYRAGLTDPQQARAINEMSLQQETFTFTFADPSMWTARTIGEIAKSTYDVYKEHGILLTKADNNHRNKITKVHGALGKMPDGLPAIQIFDTCTNLRVTLPALTADPKNRDDVLPGQEDHAFDTFAYGLTNWTPPTYTVNVQKQKKVVNNRSPLEQLFG